MKNANQRKRPVLSTGNGVSGDHRAEVVCGDADALLLFEGGRRLGCFAADETLCRKLSVRCERSC